jgi:predicted nucleic acid-binding protein
MVASHPSHVPALSRLQNVKDGTDTGIVAAHSVAELYAILTRLPVHPHITPMVARQLLEHNVFDLCEIVSLSDKEYIAVIDHLNGLGIVGGATYDALILHAASLASVDRVLTLNEKDFRRVYPTLADKIETP